MPSADSAHPPGRIGIPTMKFRQWQFQEQKRLKVQIYSLLSLHSTPPGRQEQKILIESYIGRGGKKKSIQQ